MFFYNIPKGKVLYMNYVNEDKENVLLKGTVVSDCHIYFSSCGFSKMHVCTVVKVKTALGVFFLTMRTLCGNNIENLHSQSAISTKPRYQTANEIFDCTVYESVEDCTERNCRYIPKLENLNYYGIDNRGYATEYPLKFGESIGSFVFYEIKDGSPDRCFLSVNMLRADFETKKLIPASFKEKEGGECVFYIFSLRTAFKKTRYYVKSDAERALRKSVKVIGDDCEVIVPTEPTVKDKLTKWANEQQVSLDQLKAIISGM